MSATPPAVGTQQGVSGSTPNGVSRTDSHGRKPSVVISASGTTGQIPNGGPVGQNGRPNISFGSMMNPQGSPAVTNSVPFASQTLNMPTPRHDPRIISPAHSPAPIPQPPASGGKPPSGLQSHGNGLSFGSMGMENGDANVSNFRPSLIQNHANSCCRCAIPQRPVNSLPIFDVSLRSQDIAMSAVSESEADLFPQVVAVEVAICPNTAPLTHQLKDIVNFLTLVDRRTCLHNFRDSRKWPTPASVVETRQRSCMLNPICLKACQTPHRCIMEATRSILALNNR